MEEYTKILEKYYPIVIRAGRFYKDLQGWYVFMDVMRMDFIESPTSDTSLEEFEATIVMKLL